MNNNYELGKVIVALNINITSKDVLDYYIDLVLDGIDYEKAEIIFQLLMQLQNYHQVHILFMQNRIILKKCILSQMILYTISFGEFKKSMHRLHGIIQLVIVVSVLE